MESREYCGFIVFEDGTLYKNGHLVNLYKNKKGYLFLSIKVNGKWTSIMHHRVVAAAFLGEIPDGYEVNHIDCIRDNNCISNLEYVTRRYNREYSYAHGCRDVTGILNANCKYTEEMIIEICQRLENKDYKSIPKLAKELCVNEQTIYAIKNKRQWTNISADFDF